MKWTMKHASAAITIVAILQPVMVVRPAQKVQSGPDSMMQTAVPGFPINRVSSKKVEGRYLSRNWGTVPVR